MKHRTIFPLLQYVSAQYLRKHEWLHSLSACLMSDCRLPASGLLPRWSQAAQPRPRMTRPGGMCRRRSRGSSERRCCSFRRRGPWRSLRPRNSFALVSFRSTSFFSCHIFWSLLFKFGTSLTVWREGHFYLSGLLFGL